MTKPAWSWADFERCKRAEARKAARAAAAAEISKNFAQEMPTADDASGCEGRAAEVLSGPAPVVGLVADPPMVAVKARQSRPFIPPPIARHPANKIDITRAPSLMKGQAEDWAAAAKPAAIRPTPAPPRNQVLCRCGSRFGRGSGFVPVWFGDKCIEGDCPLRGIARRKVA